MVKPTATIHVEVFPIGEPGKVTIVITSDGPANLNDIEALTVLEQATEYMRSMLSFNGSTASMRSQLGLSEP